MSRTGETKKAELEEGGAGSVLYATVKNALGADLFAARFVSL
jgi:hypothetical protein